MPVRYPQPVHTSRWSPSAAVRQRAMARSTLTCGQVSDAPWLSQNLLPAMRMTSATSQGGRGTTVYPRTAADVPDYESRVDRVDQSRSAGDGAKDANRRSS